MKIRELSSFSKILFFLIPIQFGCVSAPPKLASVEQVTAPVDCFFREERAPSAAAECGAYFSDDKNILALKKYQDRILKNDKSKGGGLLFADIFLAENEKPIAKATKKTNNSLNLVSFFRPVDSRGVKTLDGPGINGTPTRVYINNSGEMIYIGFDSQPVSLVQYVVDPLGTKTIQIENQGEGEHPHGFSAPIGSVEKIPGSLSEYDISELRELVGREGTEVTLNYESGVVVKGVIESFISNHHGGDSKPIIIRFKAGTCSVRLGVHRLFQPEWGAYDLLIIDQIQNSLGSLN